MRQSQVYNAETGEWREKRLLNWGFRPPPRFVVEPARSSRSQCHQGRETIIQGNLRLGISQVRISGKFCAQKTYWFHAGGNCFQANRSHHMCTIDLFEGHNVLSKEHLGLLKPALLCPSAPILVYVSSQEKWQQKPISLTDFASACRLAVSNDIYAFRYKN